MFRKSKSVPSNDLINTNHRQFLLTELITLILSYSVWAKAITQFFNISENLQENHEKLYFWYIHVAPPYTRVCIEFSISIEQHIFIWTRTVYGFFNIWRMKKKHF